jgi:hypothetical protein
MALARADRLEIVALFNQSQDASGLDYQKIENMVEEAANRISSWPN